MSGAPQKEKHETRSEVIRARVTVLEKAFVEQQAAAAGLGPSEYFRRRAIGHVVKPPSTFIADPALVTEINALGLQFRAIGNNANQIALNKHTGRRERMAWQHVVERMNELADQAAAALERVVLSNGS